MVVSIFVIPGQESALALPIFQSMLPPAKEDPYFVESFSGGMINCGALQSSVWISIPGGYTSTGGAHFRCDVTENSLSRWPGGHGAWDDQGYLIGFWPSDIPIDKPFHVVFEIDPARVVSTFQARYYTPNSGWLALDTVYRDTESRVYVSIPGYLAASLYPNYEDRFLIALFPKAPPTPALTTTSSLSSTPTQTVESVSPSSTPARIDRTPTVTRRPPTSIPTPKATQPAPTTTPDISPTLPAPIQTPVKTQGSDHDSTTLLKVIIGVLFVLIIVVAVVILLSRRS